MRYPLADIAYPVRVERDQFWPFRIKIVDANGSIVLEDMPAAYSSKSQTVDDIMNGVGFPANIYGHDVARDDAIAANQRQTALYASLVLGINMSRGHGLRVSDAFVTALCQALDVQDFDYVAGAIFQALETVNTQATP